MRVARAAGAEEKVWREEEVSRSVGAWTPVQEVRSHALIGTVVISHRRRALHQKRRITEATRFLLCVNILALSLTGDDASMTRTFNLSLTLPRAAGATCHK